MSQTITVEQKEGETREQAVAVAKSVALSVLAQGPGFYKKFTYGALHILELMGCVVTTHIVRGVYLVIGPDQRSAPYINASNRASAKKLLEGESITPNNTAKKLSFQMARDLQSRGHNFPHVPSWWCDNKW